MKIKNTIMGLGIILLAVIADQITKYQAVAHLKGKASFVLIKGVLEFSYLENAGAAFGSFQGMQIPLILVTLVIIGVLLWKLYRLPQNRRYLPIRLVGIFLISGAVGNLIDRVKNRYVVDFIYFVPIDFPKFNVADCYVTLSVIALILLLLFYYKEDERDTILSL